ncbi:class V chitinase [Aspergillus terreus]|uniref:chitinase n=1 Tax=Aspergillus terreus TaxID=33178 RepID=A0A5M3YUG1_ASPTE|nr:hypothetical protein ATETN484_0004030600 [Aspergillus terreus]GFF13196.1 class V chitinase [Aspergillus terreus]
MSTYGFDGVDIDWEYPVADDRNGRPEDFDNFPKFMANLKNVLMSTGGRDELSLTLPKSYQYLQHYDTKALAKSVDYFNYLSYDVHGKWDREKQLTRAFLDSHSNLTEIREAMDLLWRNKISEDKVLLGLPFYGRVYTMADANCKNPGCMIASAGNPGRCSRQAGILLNSELDDIRKEKNIQPTLDTDAAVQILTWDKQWATYDDAKSLQLKLDFARTTCLGGVVVWALKDDDPGSLRALSLVNSNVYQIAARCLYDKASIRFTDSSNLRHLVAEFTDDGRGRPFLTHATRLDIVALPERVRRIRGGEGGGARHGFGVVDTGVTIQDFLPRTVGSFMERFMSYFNLPGYLLRSSDFPRYFSEKDWEPLVSLISRLKKLKAMHYAVANSFPRSLLDAVHQHHPECEINIWSPQSLRLDMPEVSNDPFDMEILRSPCLHAIKLDYPLIPRGWPNGTFHPYQMIPYVWQAPNLKHVYLQLDTRWPGDLLDAIQKLPESSANGDQRTTLDSFALQSQILEEPILSKWIQTMDFSALRSVHVPRIDYPSSLKDAAAGLVSLERLFICVAPGRDGWEQISGELECIFQRLRPLKYLSIEALEHVTFLHTIIGRHGPSLLGLMLEPHETCRSHTSPPLKPQYTGWAYPFLDHVHLQRIAARCPNLKDLRIPIRRTKGSNEEVRTYRSLGKFFRLQNLILDLYGNPRPVISTEEGIFSDEGVGSSPPVHVSLRDVFINFATDTALAAAIWKEISSQQPVRSLLRLRVSLWGYNIHDEEEVYVFLQLAGSYLVTHGGRKVIEIGRDEKKAEQEALAETDESEDTRPFRVPRRITQTLHSIWPPASSDTDWTTCWSFPLQTDA